MAKKKSSAAPLTGGTDPAENSARAIVVVPVLTDPGQREAPRRGSSRPRLSRTPQARLAEAVGLARAIDLEAVNAQIVSVSTVRPATLIGAGKVDELAGLVKEHEAELVIVDHPLTPVQQRNLERALDAKVVDRTGLILEIFGERARTKEGVLQVDLAHLNYQKGRLVRSWTHLERQRGGAGFLGGPGETQIEADRRALQDKIQRLKRELSTVRRTRELHRAKRKKVPYPIIALVGYTNAGKSTLFNRLTGAGVLAQDMLFATLDPTLRQIRLPHGTLAIVSDTVGFISDLPTHLVAAFRATLEEVIEADTILHIRDMSDPDASAQADDVERILADLGIDAGDTSRVIEVWNKIDLLDEATRTQLMARRREEDAPAVAISAITGEGVDGLLEEVESRIAGAFEVLTVTLDTDEHGQVGWLYDNADILERRNIEEGMVRFTLRTTPANRAKIEARLNRRLDE